MLANDHQIGVVSRAGMKIAHPVAHLIERIQPFIRPWRVADKYLQRRIQVQQLPEFLFGSMAVLMLDHEMHVQGFAIVTEQFWTPRNPAVWFR